MSSPSRATRPRLATIGRTHIAREPWPDFASFDAARYPEEVRAPAARQWWRRAREEYGSIHEFSQLTQALSGVRAPIALLAALSRLITDEARHAWLCADMAEALGVGAGGFDWTAPRNPWPPPPTGDDAIYAWAADVVVCACCLGETLSRPLFEAVATVITDPVPEAVVRQILRDEHLHATFGWEALAWLQEHVDPAVIEASMRRRFAGFEQSCVPAGVDRQSLVGETVVAPPGADAPANLGSLEPAVYAAIFYATVESEIFPRFEALGLDPRQAWAERAA